MSTVIIVDAAALPETPKAFQDYVGKFFSRRTILGRECFVAAQLIGWDHRDWETIRRNPDAKGRAPGHSIEVDTFKGGLPEGVSLSQWIHQQEGRILWFVHGVDEHRDESWLDD